MKVIFSFILDIEIHFLLNGFSLDMYADYETSILTNQLSKLYDLAADNREQTLSHFMNDIVLKRKVDWEGQP